MNSVLRRMVNVKLPKISKICFYSRDQINNNALPTINNIIIDSNKNVNSLEFLGIRKLSPEETYLSLANKEGKIVNDITKSSFYKTEITFRLKNTGDIIKTRLALPYMDRYGRLLSSDVAYAIKPIFTDNVLSPDSAGIFIKLYIAKIRLSALPHPVLVNGHREIISMIYSDINKKTIGEDELAKAYTPILFYLLSTRGLMGTIKSVTDAKVEVVRITPDYIQPENTIMYRDSTKSLDLAFIVHMKERLDVIDNIISSLFYIFEIRKDRVNEFIKYIEANNTNDERDFWIILFGRFLSKGSLTYDKSTNDILTHMDKVKNYVDTISKNDLRAIDIVIEDYYDLMLVLLERFNNIVLKYKDINANLTNYKKLNVLYYVLNDVIMGVNSALIEVSKREKKQKELSLIETQKIISSLITERLVFSITKTTKKNIAVTLASGCSDRLLPYLLVSDDQNRGIGVCTNSNNPFPAPLRNITPVMFLVGCMHNLTKKAPTPILRLNPFAIVDSSNKFVIKPHLLEITKDIYRRMNSITDYVIEDIIDGDDDLKDMMEDD